MNELTVVQGLEDVYNEWKGGNEEEKAKKQDQRWYLSNTECLGRKRLLHKLKTDISSKITEPTYQIEANPDEFSEKREANHDRKMKRKYVNFSPIEEIFLTTHNKLKTFLAEGEILHSYYNCSRIKHFDRIDSLLLIASHHIYLIDYLFINENGLYS
jgi:hypothetical protein